LIDIEFQFSLSLPLPFPPSKFGFMALLPLLPSCFPLFVFISYVEVFFFLFDDLYLRLF